MHPILGLAGLTALLLAACGKGGETEVDEIAAHHPGQASGAAGSGGASGENGASGNTGKAGAGGATSQEAACQMLPSQARQLTGLDDTMKVFDGYTPLSLTSGGSVIFNTNPPYSPSGPFRNVYSVPLSGGSIKLLSSKPPLQGAYLPSAVGNAVSYVVPLPEVQYLWIQNAETNVTLSPQQFIANLMGLGIGQLAYGPSSMSLVEAPNWYLIAVAVSDSGKTPEAAGKDIIVLGIKDKDTHFEGGVGKRIFVEAGHVYNPALSPDGGFLAYWRTYDPEETIENNAFPKKPGHFELVLHNVKTSEETVIESSLQPESLAHGMRYIQRMALSNAGDIAYGVQVSAGQDGPNTHVHLYHADSGKIEDIGPGETPSISGNGARMVYEKLQGKNWQELQSSIVLRDVKTGLETFVIGPNTLARCDTIPTLDVATQSIAWYHSETGKFQIVGMPLKMPD